MKAIIQTKYGSPDVLQLREVDKPAPADNGVLVKIHAASLNAYDWHLLTADIFLMRLMGRGFFKPKAPIPGADMAGVIEAVGKDARQFKPGDEVYGDLASYGNGAFAEYTAAPEEALALKPVGLTFGQAAAVPMAGMTALQALRDKGQVKAGQKVLINGASGGVGTFAVQIAKYYGAEVTAVCSRSNVEQAQSLGADQVIDYTREDFANSSERYDMILGVNGYQPISAYKRALNPNGSYVMTGGAPGQIFQALLLGSLMSTGGKKLGAVTAKTSRKDLMFLKELLEAGKIKPVIDKRYTLSQTAEALRYLGEGHARGKIVVTMDEKA